MLQANAAIMDPRWLQQVVQKLRLRSAAGADPPTQSLVLSELWQVPREHQHEGAVEHTVGYPLDHWTYGTGTMLHLGDGKVAASFRVGLDYRNAYLSPFEEFQRWKQHARVRKQLEGGECLAYDAHTLPEGTKRCCCVRVVLRRMLRATMGSCMHLYNVSLAHFCCLVCLGRSTIQCAPPLSLRGPGVRWLAYQSCQQ